MAKQWQIQLRGKVFGPFSEAKLRHLATTGKINRKTPIRSDENSIWIVAERFSGLFTDTENIDPILSDDDDKFSAADTPSGIS